MTLGEHLGYETTEARLDVADVIADIEAGKLNELTAEHVVELEAVLARK